MIGGQENPLAQGTINRDINGRQIVTVNEGTHFTFDIPLVDFNQLSQNATSAFNLMQAITTPVPDDVAAQGDAATDYYRRLIAQGATPDVAQRLLDDEQVQKLVSAKDRWDRAVEYWGGAEFVPEKLMLRIARGDNVDITDPTAGMECGGAGTAGPCFYNPQPNVSRESVDAQTKAVFGEAAEEYKQIYARIRTAYEAGTAPNPDDLYKLEIQKEVMKSAFAANALCRGSNMGMWSEYLRQFGLGELGNSAQMDLGRYLNAGALEELGYAKDQRVRELQSQLGAALRTAVHLTPVAGAVIDGYNLYQDLSTGQYYAAGVDGALLALNLVGGAFIVKSVVRAGERVAVSEGADLAATAAREYPPIGFSADTVATAYQGMRGEGGHAIRHFIETGFIPNSGSLASRVEMFEELTANILTNPISTAGWRVGATPTRAFIGEINGQTVAICVATEGAYQGRVVTAFIPNATQRTLMGIR